MEIVLVRHGETAWNAEGRWQGQSDVPLSDKGRGEVHAAGTRFRGERFDRIVSSDLCRALHTAEGIASGLDRAPDIERDAGLREMNLGAWCGLLHSEVEARFPGELSALQGGSELGVDRRIGVHGETLGELSARVEDVLAGVVRSGRPGERVLLVTHGGVIRSVLMALLRLDGGKRQLLGTRNTAVTTLEIDAGARRLRCYNDARHLEPAHHDEHEPFLGPDGRTQVITLLGLGDDAALCDPHNHATSIVVRRKKQLVSFAVPGV